MEGIIKLMYKHLLEIFHWFFRTKNKERKPVSSFEEEKQYLYSFDEPDNDYERSFFQYLCYKKTFQEQRKLIVVNVLSFFSFLPMLIYLLINGLKRPNNRRITYLMTQDFVSMNLINKKKNEYTLFNYFKGSLVCDDLKYIAGCIKTGRLSFTFSLKNMIRIADYSKAIREYNPDTIYCSAEYSYTSSILTHYCESHNVKHINIMHGEKTFDIRDSFSRFTSFYVWDEFYTKLFKDLRCNKTAYKVRIPEFPKVVPKEESKGCCTYYLQVHTIDQLNKIRDELMSTKLIYKVRPHPKYSFNVDKVFSFDEIEDPSDVDIWESMSRAGIVISTDSTVLFQAYLIGIPTAIDDLTDQDYYDELKKRQYIMIEKATEKLSLLCSKSKQYGVNYTSPI